jgi:hypothetical protein
MGRQERRERTIWYGTRARDEHLRVVHPDGKPDCVCERSVWWFAKKKSLGCRCKRRMRQAFGSPKLASSLCHANQSLRGYHPSVVKRIEGRCLLAEWLVALRSGTEPDDIEL